MPSYRPIVGVPVDRLRKADPVTALKLTVVLGPDPMLDAAPLWAAGQIVQALKQRHGELEVAQLFLSSYRLLPDVSNDPNHSAFSPEDVFPAVWRALQESDIVLVGARECCGFPDHRNVLLLEKLDLHSQNRAREGHSEVLFRRGVVGIVLVGGMSAVSAATVLGCAWNKLGPTVPSRGVACWDEKRGSVFKSEKFAETLDKLAASLSDLAPATE